MIRHFQLILFFLSFSLAQAQTVSPWKRIPNSNGLYSEQFGTRQNRPNALLFQLDESAVQSLLEPLQIDSLQTKIQLEIPNKKGELEQFVIREFSNFDPALQAQFPNIRSYLGVGVTDPTATLYFSMSPKGIQTMVLRPGKTTEFIENFLGNQHIYEVFDSENNKTGQLPLRCSTNDGFGTLQLLNKTAAISATSGVYKTLRLALACTAEYTAYFGGLPQALAAMNATLTRVNGIFNRDLAMHLNLIANNTVLIYTNPVTDPYSASSVGVNGAWNLELQNDLTTKIGNANYDVGHLLGASGGGGNSGCIGCVCQNPSSSNDLAKGSAYTSPADGKPEGDAFDIDFVVHEIGHQLGANHTFSHEIEGTGVNVEPGGGSTIMGYAGITDYNVQSHSDDYFAYVSINQIATNLASKTCPIATILSNKTPSVSAGADYTIPKGTPFILKGSGSDPNGDMLSYCWEQNDSAISTTGANSIAYTTKTDGPLFRSLSPKVSPIRYLPTQSNVLANQLSSSWESVSDVSRNLHFTLTVRDNAADGLAQTNSDGMEVMVDATKGPFEVTSQNTADLSWKPLSLQTIAWAVNSTMNLPGSANVNIKLSVDGGLTFPTTLKANTPNDGSELIIVPNGISGKNCRILIEPTDNIFYAVNKEPFAIGYTTESICASYSFTAPFAIPESANYMTKTITVPATNATVSDVNVSINFTHQYLSDVQIELVNPQGITVKLFDKGCGATNGSLVLTYDDLGGTMTCGKQTMQIVAPLEPLSIFNEMDPSGIWTLRVRDQIAGDIGTINSASLTICSKAYTSIAPLVVDLSAVLVYPNPSKDDFLVLFSSKYTSGVTIVVHDLLGKKVYHKYFPSAPLFNELVALENVQSGVYFVTIVDGPNQTVKKIVIN
jgi:subtilisin-like proprotein convertase family protein